MCIRDSVDLYICALILRGEYGVVVGLALIIRARFAYEVGLLPWLGRCAHFCTFLCTDARGIFLGVAATVLRAGALETVYKCCFAKFMPTWANMNITSQPANPDLADLRRLRD